MLLDYIIVAAYLVVIVVIGFMAGGRLRSLRDFSVSTRHYGVFIIMATLSASFIGGGFSSGNAAKVAQFGVGNILALCGFSVSIFFVGKVIVPRIQKFQNMISTGEIMRAAYGTPAQIVTGIFSVLVCSGILGAQVGAIGYMFHVFLGLDPLVGIFVGCAIVIGYSTIGGIAAVVATDVVQFAILSIGMPILLVLSVVKTGGCAAVIAKTPPEMFDLFNGYTTVGFLSLFLSLALGEALVPPYVQRLLMGKNLTVTGRATIASSFISVPFFIITGLIGLVGAVHFAGTGADFNYIMQTMIKDMAPVGIRGLLIASMLSVVMSSADSFLNSAAVSLVNDVILPLRDKQYSEGSQLWMARVATLLTGILAVLFAVAIPNILDVLTFAYSFWSPVILVPLAGALLHVNASPRAFYTSMLSGAAGTILWGMLGNPYGVEGSIVGFFLNLLTFTFAVTTERRKVVRETLAAQAQL